MSADTARLRVCVSLHDRCSAHQTDATALLGFVRSQRDSPLIQMLFLHYARLTPFSLFLFFYYFNGAFDVLEISGEAARVAVMAAIMLQIRRRDNVATKAATVQFKWLPRLRFIGSPRRLRISDTRVKSSDG